MSRSFSSFISLYWRRNATTARHSDIRRLWLTVKYSLNDWKIKLHEINNKFCLQLIQSWESSSSHSKLYIWKIIQAIQQFRFVVISWIFMKCFINIIITVIYDWLTDKLTDALSWKWPTRSENSKRGRISAAASPRGQFVDASVIYLMSDGEGTRWTSRWLDGAGRRGRAPTGAPRPLVYN